MEFRVTVGLGQESVDPAVLDERAAALQARLRASSDAHDAVVVVDVVKAVTQLVLPVHADDGLNAASLALHIAERGLGEAGLARPQSIVTCEAEALPTALPDDDLRPHAAAEVREPG